MKNFDDSVNIRISEDLVQEIQELVNEMPDAYVNVSDYVRQALAYYKRNVAEQRLEARKKYRGIKK